MIAKTVISDIYRDLESRCVTARASKVGVLSMGFRLGFGVRGLELFM